MCSSGLGSWLFKKLNSAVKIKEMARGWVAKSVRMYVRHN